MKSAHRPVLFIVGKIQKQLICSSTDKWIKKMWSIYAFMGMLFSHKKSGIILFIARWMDLENIMLSEINQKKTNSV